MPNHDLIGQQAVVVEEISSKKTGKIAMSGVIWEAGLSEHCSEMSKKKGETVDVVDTKNIRLIVK